jgi:hypothetical protein
MHLVLFILFFQVSSNGIVTPRTNTVPEQFNHEGISQAIKKGQTASTPDLGPDTALHLQMERELGSQSMEVGTLKEKVAGLENKRETIDRPDIDGLKQWRLYGSFAVAIIGPLIGFLILYWRFFWGALLPHVRREIFGYETDEKADVT